jgi:hypothetical protein
VRSIRRVSCMKGRVAVQVAGSEDDQAAFAPISAVPKRTASPRHSRRPAQCRHCRQRGTRRTFRTLVEPVRLESWIRSAVAVPFRTSTRRFPQKGRRRGCRWLHRWSEGAAIHIDYRPASTIVQSDGERPPTMRLPPSIVWKPRSSPGHRSHGKRTGDIHAPSLDIQPIVAEPAAGSAEKFRPVRPMSKLCAVTVPPWTSIKYLPSYWLWR